MFRSIFLFLTIIISLTGLKAQNWSSIYSKELEAEDYILEKQYEKAAIKYQDALKLMTSNANLRYKIGLNYLLTPGKKHLAIDYLKEAATRISAEYDSRAIKEENAPPDALYHLGRAYQIANKFDEAISAFTSYKEYLQPDDPIIKTVEKRIESCKMAPQLMDDAQRIVKSNMGEGINNKNLNFNAVISGDGKTLAYTTLGNNGFDIYVSRKKAGKWEKPKKITDDLGANYLKTTSLSFDGNWMYLVDDFNKVANIFDTFYEDGYWVRSKKLKKPITSKFNESHAFISPDGKTLYFTSDRPGGYGGLDIYKSTQDQKERWGEPVNLGPNINTPFNEETPFLTPDGKYLFFSSEGHNTMGGYDIFYADAQGAGEVVNLGYPLNNADDNLFFFPLSVESGYVAYYDADGFGPLDIFEVKILPPVNLNGKLIAASDPANEESNLTVSIFDKDETRIIASINSSIKDGSFSHKIVPGNYYLTVTGEGFQDFSSDFTVTEDFDASTYDLEVKLIPIPEQALIAEEVQPQVEETIQEELNPEPKVEPLKEEVPETKPEFEVVMKDPVVEVTSEPIKQTVVKTIKKEEPLKETEPKIHFSQEQGMYTVQIMALIVPVKTESFANISGVTVTRGADGFYRYTVGSAETKEEAQEIRTRLVSMGYKGAFVRQVPKPVEYRYTVQIMALKKPMDINRFHNLSDVIVDHGPDNIYRYSVGLYNTLDNANFNLQRIIELGYKDAFVKKK